MALFNRLGKGLQTLFPSSGTEPHMPTELGETVSPVFEYPGRAWAIESITSNQFVSASVLTPTLDAITAGKDEWVELLWADISHDSATARSVQLALVMPPGFITFLGRWTNFLSVATPGQPSAFEPIFASPTEATAGGERVCPQRPLFVPPLGILRIFGNTAAAAYALTLSAIFCRHPYVQRPVLW
jgi:hypothetical protein